MKRITKLLLNLGFLFVLSSIFLTLCPNHTAAKPLSWWLVTVTNTSGQNVNDFHAVFSGTGGTIANAEMVENGAGAGPATIIGSGNTIDITWGSPGLPDGATFKFKFSTEFIAVYESGYFTVDGSFVADAYDVTVEEYEPVVPTLTEWALVLLALSVGGFSVWQLIRRRKTANSLR